MSRARRRLLLGWLAATAATALPAIAAAADPQPLPSGLEDLGSATSRDLSRALAKVRRRYGEDAIVIETQLLMNAMRNGSLRATEVRVDGVHADEGKKYLAFIVETGLIFDSASRDATTRVQMLWETIVAPTLAHLAHGLRVPGDGIKVVLRAHHRPYRTLQELRADIDAPGTAEQTDFYVLAPDVDAILERRETPHTLLARTRIIVDGTARTVAVAPADLPTTPGPE